MSHCYSRYCSLNLPGAIQPLQRQRVVCPLCKIAVYCSQKCRDMDWTSMHKNECKPMAQPMLTQDLPFSDTATTLRQMKRKPEDFEVIQKGGQLGKGSFGQVKLVKDKQNGTLYAMKIMNKKDVFEFCSVDNLKREIRIQRKLQHPHITKLFHYFEDKEKVYLVLEYAENGSLFTYLRKKQKLTEPESFIYFFQTCLGIDYLHKQNIIHRDLKPENLLLDEEGNIKICDFGWSAESLGGQQKRNTFCGTIDYMAPEMIENRLHDQTLDIWCLGILLYELLHGRAPFKGKNDIEKCKSIVTSSKIDFDSYLSQEVRSLINSLLKYQTYERISMQAIFAHPWMKRMSQIHQIDIDNYIYSYANQFGNQGTVKGVKSTDYYMPRSNELQIGQQNSVATTIPKDSFNHNLNQFQSQYQYKQIPPLSQNINQQQKNVLIKSMISQFNYQNTYKEEYQPRVSRVSQRDYREIQTTTNAKKNRKELSFLDKFFITFGCVKREKEQQNDETKRETI